MKKHKLTKVSLAEAEALDVLEDCIINNQGYRPTPEQLAFELWETLKDTSELRGN